MASVDNRVVSMDFDNAAFERKAGSTLGTLDKLKSKLNFGESTKQLNGLSDAGKSFDLSGIGNAADMVAHRFSAMGIAGATVMANLVNRAVDAGVKIVKAMSLQGAMEGFREFETQMDSVQTILANTQSKGTKIGDVNSALDELNQYADQTIYNFSEMTRNVGKFTAAGVDLKTSVKSIKGFSNAAAMAGAKSEETARAMYQLSQGMSSGTIKLMDWMSIENAGIGSESFRNELIRTAKTHGVNVDAMIKKEGSFRLTLQEGWLTSEIMSETLDKFTGDMTDAELKKKGYNEAQIKEIQTLAKTASDAATKVKTFTQLIGTLKEAVGSGWAKTWQIVLGDFEESKELFTSLSDLFGGFIGQASDSRNALLEGWEELGGRTSLIQSLRQVLYNLWQMITTVKDAFYEVFPRMTAKRLFELTKKVEEITRAFVWSQETISEFKRVFVGIFSALSIGITIFKIIVKSIKNLVVSLGFFEGLGGSLRTLASLGDKLKEFKDALGDGSQIQAFIDKYIKSIADFANALDFTPQLEWLKTNFDSVRESISKFVEGLELGARFENFKKELERIRIEIGLFVESINVQQRIDDFVSDFNMLKKAVESFIDPLDLGAKMDTLLAKIAEVKDAFVNMFSRDAEENTEAIAEASDDLTTRWDRLALAGEKLADFFGWIGEQLTTVAGWFGTLFDKIAEVFKTGDFQPIIDALNTGLFAGLLLVIGKFVKDGFQFDFGGGLLGNISQTFEQLTGVLSAMQQQIKADIIQKIAIALAVLAAAVLVLSLIDSEDLTKAMIAMSVGFGQLVAAFAILDAKIQGPKAAAKLATLSGGLIALAAAITVLAVATKIMSTMDSEELIRGVAGVAMIMTTVTVAANAMPDGKRLINTGIGIGFIAAAINTLTVAVFALGLMDIEVLKQGLAAVAMLLGVIAITTSAMPPTLAMIGLGILEIAGAMVILGGAVAIFGYMDPEKMVQGLFGIAGALAIIAITVATMPPNLPMIGAGILIISAAMVVMSTALIAIGSMDIDDLIKSLIGMGGALTILAIACAAMTKALPGAVAIVVASAALLILAAAIKAFSDLGFGNVIMGMLGIIVAITGIAIAAALLSGTIAPLMALATALLMIGAAAALFGLAVLGIGAGLKFLMEAVQKFLEIGADGVKLFVEVLPKIGVALLNTLIHFAAALLESIPKLVEPLGRALVSIGDALITVIPKLGEVIGMLIDTIIQLVRDRLPDLFIVGFEMFVKLLEGIRDNIPTMVGLIGEIIVSFLTAMAERMPYIIEAGTTLIVSFLTGIKNNIWTIIEVGKSLVLAIIFGLGSLVDSIIAAGAAVIIHLIKGIGEKAEDIVTAGVDTVLSFLEGLGKNAVKLAEGAATVLIQFLNGMAKAIDENAPKIREAGLNLARAIIDGVTGGLATKAGEVVEKLKEIASTAIAGFMSIFGIESPSKVMYKLAGYISDGLTNGLNDDTKAAKGAKAFGNSVLGKLKDSLDEVGSIADSMSEFNPTIKPVMDLSDIEHGSSKMNSLMAEPTLDASVSFGQAASLSLATKDQERSQTETTDTTAPAPETKEITFNQTIIAPDALSSDDIYRQTKSQIAFAKEELSV